jgi:serine/threonine protein kinase
LAEYIRRRRKLPEPEAMKIFGQIVRGLSAMHQFKIMHRDLKPANILLKNGKAKIADFGLACKFSRDHMLRSFAGTPIHMAPEILKGQLYNQKVDVYSAGTVLYEMLYGVIPFRGRDVRALIESIERGKMNEAEAAVSPKTRNLLKEMLQS